MAGEWSKKIGEDGERIANKLLGIIGWGHVQKGLDIPCIENVAHDRKRAHGLDGLFTYKSPLHDRLLKHVCISVKYSDSAYPSGQTLVTSFKDHLKKLDHTVECFECSENRIGASSSWTTGVDRSESMGLLIWMHGDRSVDSTDDIIDKLETINIPSDIELKHPILLLDQKRIKYLTDADRFVAQQFQGYKITFNYHRSGQNHNDADRTSNGSILPWELLSTGVIVYRAVKDRADEKVLIIISIDKFNEDGFRRLLGFAHSISDNLPNKINISFPDYVGIKNENSVNAIKSSFEDSDFTNSVVVSSYSNDIRD